MTKFGIVDPKLRSVSFFSFATLKHCLAHAGLDAGAVDHGTLFRDPSVGGLGVVVGDSGLFEPVDRQDYFMLHGQFFAGPAVLYGFDSVGRTVDVSGRVEELICTSAFFFDGLAEIESAFKAGRCKRPRMAFDDYVHWEWPQPKPDMNAWARMVSERALQGPIVIDGDTIITTEPEERS